MLVAEVLLRRTQAERVAGPYLDLIERYPETRDMADADVAWLREWFRPLGLVSRADLLIDAAKAIVEKARRRGPAGPERDREPAWPGEVQRSRRSLPSTWRHLRR